jgi:hypothetical protein
MFSTAISCAVLLTALAAGENDLPDAKPVPDVQVVPLPNNEASFQHLDRELTRYYYGPSLARPFWYPIAGPAGRTLTRMGHPRDPQGHSHHNSVWISHNDVGGVSFWADRGSPPPGRIVHQAIDEFEDGPARAWMLSRNAWQGPDGKTVAYERRRAEVRPLEGDQWLMLIDVQLETPGDKPVVLGKTPFGMIGVRMAKTIGVHDGGGRILNSDGLINEEQVFRKPARWVDDSGPVTNQLRGGIALLDHPANPGHPTPFHVREDGWMGASLTLNRPLTIEPGRPLRLRYGLWVHGGVPQAADVDRWWIVFAKDPLPPMTRLRK